MSFAKSITAVPSDNLRAQFAERAYSDADFESLVRIERHAGNASWSREQLTIFVTQLEFDTRIVTKADSPERAIAFYLVEHGDKTLYLGNIAVAPEWRRRGVAAYTLKAAASLARRLAYERIALDVQEENLAAQLLYRQAGFRAVRVRPNYYRGQDGYHMVKNLR